MRCHPRRNRSKIFRTICVAPRIWHLVFGLPSGAGPVQSR
jgi:hypothetical protein